MAIDGVISQQECDTAVLPMYSRTWQEWMEPFGLQPHASFQLVHTAQRRLMAPAWSRFKQTGDAVQLGADYAGSMASCSKRCLQQALLARPADEQEKAMSDLFQRFSNLVEQDPCESLGDFIMMDLVKP